MDLLSNHTGDFGDRPHRKRLPTGGQRGILRHRRVQGLPRPVGRLLGIERREAHRAPAARTGLVCRRGMVVDPKVIVDPHATWLERRVDARHLADIGEKSRLARTVAVSVLHARRPRPTRPVLRRTVFAGRQGIRMPERRLKLKTGDDADLPQIVRSLRKALRLGSMPRKRWHADARGEPHLVAATRVLGNRLIGLPPLRHGRRMGAPQTQGHHGNGGHTNGESRRQQEKQLLHFANS